MPSTLRRNLLFLLLVFLVTGCVQTAKNKAFRPDPVTNPDSDVMLAGNWLPDHTHDIDFDALTKIPSHHVVE